MLNMNPSTSNFRLSTPVVSKSRQPPKPLMRGETGNRPFERVEQWRPDISRMSAVAHAIVFLAKGRLRKALTIAHDNKGGIERVDWHLDSPKDLANVLLQELQKSLEIPMGPVARDESVFKREADYWTIIYDGQTARLKATRGLKCLAHLLCHPGREFHVIELITGRQKPSMEGSTALLCASGPILDGKAKAECKRRLEELRADLDEAERFNDPERAVRVRDEMHSIAAQLASAVGLGGRNRRPRTDAKRARSAVTKRVKESINNIGEAIPSLGRHLTGRIKTGYYCSYNPRPDRLVAWKF